MLPGTRAGAVILAEADAERSPAPVLISDNPYLLYARIAALLHPARDFEPGISPRATVEDGATVAASAWVGPGAVVEEAAEFADNSPLPGPEALYSNVWAEINPNGRLFFDGRGEG